MVTEAPIKIIIGTEQKSSLFLRSNQVHEVYSSSFASDDNEHVCLVKCTHPPLSLRIMNMCGLSQGHAALCFVIKDKTLLNELNQLTHFHHTASLENFNTVLLKVVSKCINFSYEGIRARRQVACLSYNEYVS